MSSVLAVGQTACRAPFSLPSLYNHSLCAFPLLRLVPDPLPLLLWSPDTRSPVVLCPQTPTCCLCPPTLPRSPCRIWPLPSRALETPGPRRARTVTLAGSPLTRPAHLTLSRRPLAQGFTPPSSELGTPGLSAVRSLPRYLPSVRGSCWFSPPKHPFRPSASSTPSAVLSRGGRRQLPAPRVHLPLPGPTLLHREVASTLRRDHAQSPDGCG